MRNAHQVNLPGWCWAKIQQLALIGSSSSLHSEVCNALGASDGVIHSRISQEVICLRAIANKIGQPDVFESFAPDALKDAPGTKLVMPERGACSPSCRLYLHRIIFKVIDAFASCKAANFLDCDDVRKVTGYKTMYGRVPS